MQYTGLPLQEIATMAGAATAAVTLLYILKLKKRRVQVPFSPIWGRVLAEYRQQSDWWRHFRRFLSWLLHIALIAALGFALMDPHPEAEITQGRHIVLLIDSSASMASTDVSGGANRLDVAKQKARQILETVGAQDRVMLVNFNEQLQPLSPFVGEASLLEQPIRDIKVTGTGTQYGHALAFAADSLRDKKLGELILLSDGAGFAKNTLEEMDFGEHTTVRHLKIGERSGNLAVTAFSVRRYLANKLDYELYVGVQSFFERDIEAELHLLADGKLVDAKPITLKPQETLQEFFPSQAVSGERLEARVKITTTDARDVFPLDDRAYALLPKSKVSEVLLVTQGNLYLEGTLLLNANIKLTRVKTTEYDPSKAFDVVFFDRFAPKVLPQSGNFVFIAPDGDHSPWKIRAHIKEPLITSYKKSHPLMRWIGMRDVNIGLASKFKLEPKDRVIATSFGTPIIVSRDAGAKRYVGLAFDIRNSDLPLRVAFPVLMINLIDYFQFDDERFIQNFATGKTWNVKVAANQGQALVVHPNKREVQVPIYDGRAVVYGEQVGFYTVQSDGIRQTLAANLSDPRESKIAPIELQLPQKKVSQNTDKLFFDRKELWIWSVLGILAMLLLEWWTYNRRITI